MLRSAFSCCYLNLIHTLTLVLLPRFKPPVGELIFQLKMNEYVHKNVRNFSYDNLQTVVWGILQMRGKHAEKIKSLQMNV